MTKIIDLRETKNKDEDVKPQEAGVVQDEVVSEPDEKKENGIVSFFVELVKVVVISLAIVLPVRYFLIQPFYVKGASMEPSFYDDEYLIINEIVYRLGTPARGDIVVFKYPRQPNQYFIKRIIGLPGERVVIKNNEVIIYNKKHREGRKIDESSYLSATEKTLGVEDITLKSDEYFVLGDNRAHSLDSRSFGAVPEDNIIGKTWIRGWPLDRLKKFSGPDYNL